MSLITQIVGKSLGARTAARHLLRRRPAILMYHGLTASPLPVYNWCHVPVDEFRAQMEWLKQNYRVLPLREVILALRNGSALPERSACITFDDGFRSVSQYAAPILESLEMPFTVFLLGSLCEKGDPPWPERIFAALLGSVKETVWWNDRKWSIRTASEREDFYTDTIARLTRVPPDKRAEKTARLLELLGEPQGKWNSLFTTLTRPEWPALTASGLCSLGAHSQTHAILTTCSDEQVIHELHSSRNALREESGYVDVFAYPHGIYDSSVAAAVRNAGFEAAVTVEHRLCRAGDDVFETPRVGIGAGLPMNLFECKVLGF